MTSPDQKTVRIVPNVKESTELSRSQKQFNALIKKIEKLKKQLIDWQELAPRFQQRLATEHKELLDTFNDRRVELMYLLDKVYADKLLSNRDRQKITHLIQRVTTDVISEHSDIALKALHDKYSDTSFDEQQREHTEMLKNMVEEMLGINIGDDVDVSSPEKLHAFMQQLQQEEQQKVHEQQFHTEARPSKRKKTPKQIEKEAKQKAEELNIHKSLQEVYRKLVAALHPDRERDNAERDRKTALMQRVTVAYSKKDLLQLLELQLEAEHIDPTQLRNLSEDRLHHYNKILKEQSDELQQEIDETQLPFKVQFNIPPFEAVTPTSIGARLDHEIKQIRHGIAQLQHDLQTLQNAKRVKTWLKHYHIPAEPDLSEFADMLFDDVERPRNR